MRLAIFEALSISSLFLSAWSMVTEVDDSEAAISYQPPGAWSVWGASDEFHSTTHITSTPFAYFTFTFTGTGIQVIGTQSNLSPGNFTYLIDDGLPQSGIIENGPRIPNTTYVDIQNLNNTKHIFTFRNGGPAAIPFVFDLIRYTNDSLATTPLPTTVESRDSLNVGALVGGLVGGLFCLGILVFAAILFYQRRAALNQPDGAPWQVPPSYTDSMLVPEPYPTPDPPPVDPNRPSLMSLFGNRKEILPPSAPLPPRASEVSLLSPHESRTDLLPPPVPVGRSKKRPSWGI